MMEMQKVESSNVKAVGYDPLTREMRVEFHGGGIYHLNGVSEEDHQNFLAADSKGKHFHRHIRGMFESKKVA